MGVTGLWKLIEGSSKVIPLETLENKVLAIDISIWLYQIVKGFQDAKGGQVQNAHLIGLFNRICKLLYFKIKPIFVFDGGCCELKRQTLAKRAQSKSKIKSDAERIEALLLENLAKEQLIKQALGDETRAIVLSPSKIREKTKNEKDDIFKLPEINDENLKVKAENEINCPKKSYNVNISKIDLNSSNFKSLPADIRHDILTDIKETRKQNSWAKLRDLPPDYQDFSSYQMSGLLKRRQVQVNLESAEKEMGGKVWSLSELESLLTEDGVLEESKHAQRIANDPSTRFILVRDIAKAMNDAKEAEKYVEAMPSTSKQAASNANFGEEEIDLELQRAIQMSLEEEIVVKEEEIKVGPIKLNAEQRKKLGGTVHGLVRGYMMEYAEMNDDNLKDLMDASQVSQDGSEIEDSLQAKFPNTDPYVLYGTQGPSNQAVMCLSDNEDTDVTENKTELIITVDSNEYKKEDDIFADIFSSNCAKSQTPDIEVASISSSDDDTVDYEVPELNTSRPTEEQTVNEKEETSSSEIMCENEKFWSKTKGIVNSQINAENQDIKDLEDDKSPTSLKSILEQQVVMETKKYKDDVLKVTNGEIKVMLSPQKTLITKEEVNKAVNELKKAKTHLELEHMKEELYNQQVSYEFERNKLNRQGASITQQMTNDCKQLLKLFGIPYIQATMEAEAQCAFLNSVKITDGTITDDSDIFLFGAEEVYKNFFVQKKMVMEFKSENLEKMLHLDRNKLIQLAMLVGSDYTVGINGIGAVTAMEILSAFPPTPEEKGLTDKYQSMLSSLRKFREWFMNGKQDLSKGKAILKNKLKNIEIFDGFPSINVLRAYMEPMIDDSTEPFTWGEMDIESILELTKSKLGWTRAKTEEILNPVIKKMNDKKQSTIKDYFQVQMKKIVFDEQKLSTRVQKAVKRMAGEDNDDHDNVEARNLKTIKKRSTNNKSKKSKQEKLNDDTDMTLKQPSKSPKEDSPKKQTHKRKIQPSTSKAANDDEPSKKKSYRVPEIKQVIPQSEKDKKNAEENKQKAVEIFMGTKKLLKKN